MVNELALICFKLVDRDVDHKWDLSEEANYGWTPELEKSMTTFW